MTKLAIGVVLGACLGAFGVAVAQQMTADGGDHYQMGWSVLAHGAVICQDPFIRPSDREIDCRSATRR